MNPLLYAFFWVIGFPLIVLCVIEDEWVSRH